MAGKLVGFIKVKSLVFSVLFVLLLTSGTLFIKNMIEHSGDGLLDQPTSGSACTSFCLDTYDYCLFGSNLDNSIDDGLLVVNPRQLMKTAWTDNTKGEYARWVSKYGSVTFDLAGYQMAWAGMNEAGLMVSTMALSQTVNPSPDARLPLTSPLWVQYVLDNFRTVDEVIASDSFVRILDTRDHYLVCDRSGDCAVIEFLDGKRVYYAGQTLPMKVLANDPYQKSVTDLQNGNNLLSRFIRVKQGLEEIGRMSSEADVSNVFNILAEVALDNNAWQMVFDPDHLQVSFRTNRTPEIRYVDFSSFDLSCHSPILMQPVQSNLKGDIFHNFLKHSHWTSLTHTLSFISQYTGTRVSPVEAEILLRGMESFPCMEADPSLPVGVLLPEGQKPLLPPVFSWAILAFFYDFWPVGLFVILFCFVYFIHRSPRLNSAFSCRLFRKILAKKDNQR